MAQEETVTETITRPVPGGGGGELGPLLIVLGLAGLAYFALKGQAGATPSLGVIHGDLVQEQYPASAIGPCDQAQAVLTVVNPTDASKTYTILGTVTDASGAAVAHWWPDGATGASKSTAYHGLTVTVPPFRTAQVTATTSPWSLPGTFGAHWTLEWNGTTLTTRTQSAAFHTSFTTAPHQCGAPA